MKISKYIETISDSYSPMDAELLQRALDMAEEAHQGQKRASGEPYITHCKAVASILSEMNVPPAVVAAGLLHDTVEDTELAFDELRANFGEEVSELVRAVTKLDTLPRVSKSGGRFHPDPEDKSTNNGAGESVGEDQWRAELASENLRKTFLAMADDPRVVLIKLADRLHNMRTLHYLRPEKQKRIARETMELFAPLASRLGIWQIKWDLEDLAFRYLDPETYRDIAAQLDERRSERERRMEEIIKQIQRIMSREGMQADITGRPKHIYSIYRKMNRKGIAIDQISDLRGVRIIVPTEEACYAAVGIVHSHWRPVPGEFDDYIAAPKPSLYQSIHTAVIYDDGKTLEVQIRTPEMHRKAEYGIAAHWRYKEGKRRDPDFEQRVAYLRQMLDWQQDVSSAQEFVDGLKTDVFGDRVYAFTPRGDIIDLPVGATPIDFAYNIHTEVGHRCRGAKVNGKLVSLDHKLTTGDQVEILTAKRGGPSRDWLNENLELVKTKRARAKIRRWFKQQERDQNVESGRSILEREISRLDLGMGIDYDELAETFRYQDPEDLFAAVGCGDISVGRVINGLVTIIEGEPTGFPTHYEEEFSRETSQDITVLGLKGLRNHLAGCCNPTPGDEIVGYITRGRGATIHRRDCANILSIEDKERLVEVSWGSPERTFPVPVQIKAYDRDGLTRDIANVLSNNNISLSELRVDVDHSRGEAMFNLVLGVRNVSELRRILDLLVRINNVYEARRARTA